MVYQHLLHVSGAEKEPGFNVQRQKDVTRRDRVKTTNRTIQKSHGAGRIGFHLVEYRDNSDRDLRSPSPDVSFVVENEEFTSLLEVRV